MLKAIRNRLAEPSTWAGVSGLLLANTMLMGDEYKSMLGCLALISGSLAILLKEHRSDT